MRRCGTCGYLILGDVDQCSQCGAPLGAPVAAGSVAGTASQPAPPTAPPAPPRFVAPSPIAPLPAPPGPAGSVPPAPGPVGAPPALPGMFAPTQWAPAPDPMVGTQTRSGGPRASIAVLAVMALVLAGIGYTWYAHRNALPSGTSDFVAGKGVVYSPDDKAYSAQFPSQPEVDSESTPVGTVTLTMNLASTSGNDYELGIGEMPWPGVITAAQAGELLTGAMKNGASAAKLSLENQHDTTVEGLPAIEAHAKDDSGYPVRMLVIAAQRHVYMLIVHAKVGTDRLYDALLASFVALDRGPA